MYDNIQNVLDNYTNIYFDNEQNSIGFVKVYGKLADCLFVKNDNGKNVLFGSTYNQPELRLHSSRYKKITPVKKQEFKNTVEVRHISSTARQGLSDPAAGISTLNGNSNISQTSEKSSLQSMVHEGNTYGFAYEGKNREATETIKTVIAKYSNSDGYSYFRSQVGAVIASLDSNISQFSDESSPQLMVQNSKTYGFAYEGKIYLNPAIMTSEVAVHEYTHLWDAYT